MAETARIESGQRSRSSKTNGRAWQQRHDPGADTVNNCGEVPTRWGGLPRSARNGAGNHEAHVVESALRKALILGDVGPYPDHVDPLDDLAPQRHSGSPDGPCPREVRRARDHRHLRMAELHPSLGMLETSGVAGALASGGKLSARNRIFITIRSRS